MTSFSPTPLDSLEYNDILSRLKWLFAFFFVCFAFEWDKRGAKKMKEKRKKISTTWTNIVKLNISLLTLSQIHFYAISQRGEGRGGRQSHNLRRFLKLSVGIFFFFFFCFFLYLFAQINVAGGDCPTHCSTVPLSHCLFIPLSVIVVCTSVCVCVR